jgi:hypothetical protein
MNQAHNREMPRRLRQSQLVLGMLQHKPPPLLHK